MFYESVIIIDIVIIIIIIIIIIDKVLRALKANYFTH